MSRSLPRFTNQEVEIERKLARILLESGEAAPAKPPAGVEFTRFGGQV